MATPRESYSFLCKDVGLSKGEIDPSLYCAKEDKEVESETPECSSFFFFYLFGRATTQLPNEHTETYL